MATSQNISTSGVPEGLREFDDTEATRSNIYSNMLDAVTKRFPIESGDYRLELVNPRYEGPQTFSLEQQKQALLKDRRLNTAIKGTWRLTHIPTKKVIEEREDSIIQVPYYTDRGTIINNGNEYTVISQSRLRPGVYTRKRKTGEIETQFNVKNGKGFRLNIDNETGVFKMSSGQSHVPLYPILKSIGVTDKQMINAWGADIVAENAKKTDPQALKKVYERYAGYKADPLANDEVRGRFIKEAMANSEVDEDIIVRTMGLTGVKNVTPELILRASQKMLNINRGEEQADNRDNPRFSSYHGVEHLLRERVDKDAGKLTQNMMRKIKYDRSLRRIPRNALNPYVDNFLLGSGLTMPGEEANVLSTLEQMTRITKMGEGGIQSADAVTDEARAVQGDYLGFVDNIQGPESERIGIDVRAAHKTYLGKDNKLYGEFTNLRTGKTEYIPIDKATDGIVAFPGQDPKAKMLDVIKDGVPQRVPREEVTYMVPSFAHSVASNINMNPMPTAVQAGRQFYGAKFWSQYLPQVKGEVPLVDSLMPDGKQTFSEYYGRKVGTLKSPISGEVVKVTDAGVTIKDEKGKTHLVETVKDLPFNRMTGISYTPSVKVGDSVKAGDMVANSNFTDSKTGAINMGQNLKVAIIPYKGNFEDAHVISESCAKRMATERLFTESQDTKNGVIIDKKKYMSAFPQNFTKDQFETLDDTGVVKKGTILQRGDPIIVGLGPKVLSSADAQLGKLSKVLRNSFTNKVETWEHDWPGVVVDTVRTASGAKVNIKSTPPVAVGDKLSGRFGLKGVVSRIIPDDEMPRDAATNQPYDMLVNPMGFLSRVAPGQLMEVSLGKIAKSTGQQVRIPQLPPKEGWANWVQAQMDANGLKDSTDIFDPKTGKTIKNVGDGYMFVSAFHHLAEKKASQRGNESAYTQDEQPAKGGEDGAKRFSGFDRNAVLAHGATAVIKDAMTIRGTKNEDYWNKLRLGLPLPEPGVPFIYDKFLNTLRAGGINVIEKGNITQIMPMTDKDIDTLSGGRIIENSSHLDSDFEPIKGGLFDLGKTGGAAGNHWSAIKLPEPVPNPIMEEPVRRVLGLSVKQLEAVLAGREQLNGKTGGAAIKEALADVDIDKKIAECRERIRKQRGSNRDDAIKILGYLTAMKEQGATPQDWMISKVPVLPPKFRPISRMGDVALVSDLNELYRDVIENANSYTELHKELGDEGTHDERLNIYNSVKAAFGLGQSITPEGQAKNIKGAIRQVVGDNPKFGMAQAKVLSKTVDIVGRGVVTPDPDLDMDQVGIPEKAAWEIYRPFVMRGLVRRGYPPVQAIKMLDDKHDIAKQLLEEEMSRRPVLMDRAPTWHKFNIMAFTPHITEGNTVRVCPLIVSGFNMDFDGDGNVCSARVYAKSGVLESAMYGIKKTALQSIKNLIH